MKSQHIADEAKKVDDKVSKNSTDIINSKNALEHNKGVINDLERNHLLVEDFIITLNNLTFFLNQGLNHLVEMDGLLIHGHQQEFKTIVIILTCFL